MPRTAARRKPAVGQAVPPAAGPLAEVAVAATAQDARTGIEALGALMLDGVLRLDLENAPEAHVLSGHLAAMPGVSLRHSRPLHDCFGRPTGRLNHFAIGEPPSGEGPGKAGPGFAALADLASGYLDAVAALGAFDHVTLLPNRLGLLRDMERQRLAAPDLGCTLCLATLADARHYNEMLRALGHEYADDFVRACAAIVRGCIPASLPVFHVSVLSLAIVIPDERHDAEAIAARLGAAFVAPVTCQGVPIGTRLGVGLAAIGGDLAETLRAALAAAQDSRSSNRGWSRYDRASDIAHRRAFTLLADMPAALAMPGQLALHFQPRVDLPSHRCGSAEALLRWRHPEFGNVSPGEFVPLVETTALIDPLTDWVLEHGLDQLDAWLEGGIDLMLALNISPNNLRKEGFVDRLAGRIVASGIPPDRLELEFTEGALTSAEPGVRQAIEDIRGLGITIAIDDFGTGYSNMSYLTRLPANVIKIDQSFVRTLWQQPRQQLLVRAIMDMAHALGFRTVAEGIESEEVYDLLQGWGCEEGQGYLMSRPLPPADFPAWFRHNNA